MGANAVIGVDIDYEVLGADNGMLDGNSKRNCCSGGLRLMAAVKKRT